MWNDKAEQQELEAKLQANDLSVAERIQTLLALAYIARSFPESELPPLKEAEAILKQQSEDEFVHERIHAQYIRQFRLGAEDQRIQAIKLCEDILTQYKQLGDTQGEAHVLLSLTSYHNSLRNYPLARDYIEQLRALVDTGLLPAKIVGNMLEELAHTYLQLGLLDLARKYGLLALEYGLATRFGSLWTLSEIAFLQDDFSEALGYIKTAVEIAEELDNTLWIMLIMTRLGRCQRGLEQYDDALTTLHKALENYADKTDHHFADTAIELGRVYRDMGQFENAEKWILEAQDIFEQKDSKLASAITMRALSELYYQWEKYENSIDCLRAYHNLNKELVLDEQRTEIASLAAQYEYQLSQKELEFSRFQNEMLAHRNKLLQQAYNEQKEILGIVAHDLKNPLTAIGLQAGMLNSIVQQKQYDLLPERKRRIEQSVAYMTEIISQFTTMGSIDSGNERANLQSISIPTMLMQVVQRNQPAMNRKRIRLKMQAYAQVAVLADHIMIQQVFDNLLSNSIKYSHANSKIEIVVSEQEDWVTISFVDEGVGIAADEMSKLFTKFGRLSGRPTASESSTGLGLYNAKKFIEMMGGKIVANSPGTNLGSTFTVWLQHALSEQKVYPEG